ncbi:proline-rich transmembrane protein 4 [Sander lucioperca]|uniref:proline-rich transmembrane protein 4 n=1 Tax=Sander lucioperca TaxID=283035 RepID=UPI00125D48FC|nr:proline-rich transmembrane protein 4 [Sander lucioperca]
MLSLWNLYLLLPLSLPLSLHVIAFTGENVKETQQPVTDTAVQRLKQPPQRPHGSDLAPGNPVFGTENVDLMGLPVSWPLSSSEELDRQGVIGEYIDLQESTETSLLNPNEKGLIISRPVDTEDAISKESAQTIRSSGGVPTQPTQEQTLKYQPSETSTGSILHSTQTGENQPTFSASQNETTDSQLPFLLSGSFPSGQDSTSHLSAGPGPSPERTTPPVASWGWTTAPSVITQGETQEGTVPVKETENGLFDIMGRILHRGAVSIEADKDGSMDDDLHLSKTSGTLLLNCNTDTSAIPCKTSNQSWTPTYPDDVTPNESPGPSLDLSPAFFVPLYSDWNSALATWGFAWEAHVYGLGSVFTVFGLISVVCLLGLPLRCPPGSPYFTLLHLFLLAFSGIQAFCLLYDAYNHQDRLPPLGSLLLSELPFPCLISAFSLAFLLLSLRSRMHLSLPLANSTSFSALPKPCLLLCMSLLYSGVSLGCVGMLQLFHSLPSMILLFPQGVFVCLTVFLSCSYLIFYCLMQFDTKHIYRLNDNGESGGSPVAMQPASCPFAKAEDWGRAAGAGVGASLCLLGCGGLQLYGILHALGLGGVDGYGFQPWPWWGYQVGCRLCEVGVCLGLSLIGSHPLFCHNSSIKTITHPRPGSWSRLSCSSPSRGLTLPSQRGADFPVLSSHDSWSQGKQEKLVVCDVITKGQSEALPLFSMVDPPGNGQDCVPKSSQTQSTLLPLPTPPSPPHKPKSAVESQLSSLDSLRLEIDSTVDLQPPSPIDLSRSIDQALFSESLFSHSIFGLPRLFHASSSLSLSPPSQGLSKQGPSSVENALYRTSSCGDVDQENGLSSLRPSQPHGSLTSHSKPPMSPEQWDWKESISGSTHGLCSNPKEKVKLRSHSWANRGQNIAQSSLPRAIPHLSYHRRYQTLSLASQDSHGSGRLAGTKHLSESKQLEWDLAVQAEFVNVCRQIDTLSVCSDTIEL